MRDPHKNVESFRTPPVDREFGAFSLNPPWLIDPNEIIWLKNIPDLRSQSKSQLPSLTVKRLLPPGSRVLTTAYHLLSALAIWKFYDKKVSKANSVEKLATRLRIAFEKLGPTYIKLGQIISNGDGIFPSDLVSQFKLLRDQVSPEPFNNVRQTVESELGATLEDLFIEFDEQAMAAASIAQVHRARLRSGELVVVKVQRTSIDQLVEKDLAAMSWFAPTLVGRIPVTALANPPSLVELFAETIVEELDFRLEAANMLDIAKVLAETDQNTLVVPRPHPRFVTKKVLIME